jgi:hypothetical protein
MVDRELPLKRERLNASRRCYHRTKNNEELSEYRKNEYFEEKTKYQATKEKLKTWKEYCNKLALNITKIT